MTQESYSVVAVVLNACLLMLLSFSVYPILYFCSPKNFSREQNISTTFSHLKLTASYLRRCLKPEIKLTAVYFSRKQYRSYPNQLIPPPNGEEILFISLWRNEFEIMNFFSFNYFPTAFFAQLHVLIFRIFLLCIVIKITVLSYIFYLWQLKKLNHPEHIIAICPKFKMALPPLKTYLLNFTYLSNSSASACVESSGKTS